MNKLNHALPDKLPNTPSRVAFGILCARQTYWCRGWEERAEYCWEVWAKRWLNGADRTANSATAAHRVICCAVIANPDATAADIARADYATHAVNARIAAVDAAYKYGTDAADACFAEASATGAYNSALDAVAVGGAQFDVDALVEEAIKVAG